MAEPLAFIIRKAASEKDWESIREICALTGYGGEPIETRRWRFFAELWIGPYQRLLPDWTYVAATPGGKILGYLTACPDTEAFTRSRGFRFTLPLLARVMVLEFGWNSDVGRFVRRTLGLESGPEESFSPDVLIQTFDRFPAHLHMNLLSEARGGGAGSALVAACLQDLRSAGVPGIHLFCGEAPAAFYRKNGFGEVSRVDYKRDVPVLLMARSTVGPMELTPA